MKAVAIPYVIALILGIMVVGILAYWLINQAGKTTAQGASAECQGKIFSYCLAWDAQGKKCSDGQPSSFDWGNKCTKPSDFKIDNCKSLGICT